MAADGRRETRKEPVEVVVETDAGEHTFLARPLPWRKRIDLGDMLTSMYSGALDAELKALRDDAENIVGIEGSLFERSIDYGGLFVVGFSKYTPDDDGGFKVVEPSRKDTAVFNMLEFDQMVEVLSAALTVNGLDRIVHFLDPDRKKDLMTGVPESLTVETTSDTEKMELPTDSG